MKFRIFGFRTPYALVVLVLVNFIICNVFEKKVWKEIQSIVDTLLCDSALVRSFKQTDVQRSKARKWWKPFWKTKALRNNLMSIVLYDLNDSSWSKLPHICRFQHLRKPNVVMSAAVVVFRIEQLWSKHALVCWNLNILSSSELESRWSCCCVPNIFYQNKSTFLN